MYQYKATIVGVVDGDTFDMDVDLGFHIHIHERIRVLGVDTPETTARVSEEDKRAGLAVKNWAVVNLMGAECIIETEKTDSFGRWLANVEVNGIDLRGYYNLIKVNKLDEGYDEAAWANLVI